MDTSRIRDFLDEARAALVELKQHHPFKKFKKLGNKSPAKRKGPDKVKKWSCTKKSKYVQTCVGIAPETEGRTKVVRIDPDYKAAYNADYKAGVSSGQYVPGARSGGKPQLSAKAKAAKAAATKAKRSASAKRAHAAKKKMAAMKKKTAAAKKGVETKKKKAAAAKAAAEKAAGSKSVKTASAAKKATKKTAKKATKKTAKK